MALEIMLRGNDRFGYFRGAWIKKFWPSLKDTPVSVGAFSDTAPMAFLDLSQAEIIRLQMSSAKNNIWVFDTKGKLAQWFDLEKWTLYEMSEDGSELVSITRISTSQK